MNNIKMEGIFNQGYGFIAKAVMRDRELHVIAKAIYSYICSYSGKGKDAFPSQKLICYDLDINKDTLIKYIKQLTNKGYIVITKNSNNGKFANNIYSIKVLPCTISPDTERTDTDFAVHGEVDTNKNIYSNNNRDTNNNTNTSGEIFLKKLTTKELLIDGINSLDISEKLKESFINYLEYRILLKKPWKTMIPINSAIKNMLSGEEFKSEKHLMDSMKYSMENEWLKIVPTKIDTVPKNSVSVKQNIEGFKRPSSRVVIGFENGKPIYEK